MDHTWITPPTFRHNRVRLANQATTTVSIAHTMTCRAHKTHPKNAPRPKRQVIILVHGLPLAPSVARDYSIATPAAREGLHVRAHARRVPKTSRKSKVPIHREAHASKPYQVENHQEKAATPACECDTRTPAHPTTNHHKK